MDHRATRVITLLCFSFLLFTGFVRPFPTNASNQQDSTAQKPNQQDSTAQKPNQQDSDVQKPNQQDYPPQKPSQQDSTALTPNDTVLAKHGNTTIIFGHQFVLFSAPTRAPHPAKDLMVQNLLSPTQSKGNDAPIRIDYTTSEEKEFLDEYSDEVEEDAQRRQELCPGTGRGRQQLLFDRSVNKCAKVGDKAHCGPNMVFRYDPFVDNSTVYGYCECDFTLSRTPLVFHAETNSCYFIYQKAYCDTKEWLVFNGRGDAECQKRICQKSSSRRSKLLTELVEVPINGTGPCVPLNQPSKYCQHPEDTVHFHVDELVPRCGIQRLAPAPRIISPVRQVRCRPGSYVNIVGRCQPVWEWR